MGIVWGYGHSVRLVAWAYMLIGVGSVRVLDMNGISVAHIHVSQVLGNGFQVP